MTTAPMPLRTPTDPLEALGDSVFLTILASLPYYTLARSIPLVRSSWAGHYRAHQTSIWRQAAAELGTDIKKVETDHAADIDESKKPVDWLEIVKVPALLDQNWWTGKCKEKVLVPALGRDKYPVWKFRVNEEPRALIVTSRSMAHGMLVSNLTNVAHPLFDASHFRLFAHLDLCKGYAVFDCGGVACSNQNLSLQIYRTQSAIDRSKFPYPSATELPHEAQRSRAWTDRDWAPEMALKPEFGGHPGVDGQPDPVPRGGLAFFREIYPPNVPPFPALPYRLHADAEGTAEERMVLAMASAEAVYLWDVDDEAKEPEVFEIPKDQHANDVSYLEIDDDYILLAGSLQLHVFSRRTKERILAFPPLGALEPSGICSVAYAFDLDVDEVQPVHPSPAPASQFVLEADGAPTAVGRAVISGVRSDDPACDLATADLPEAEATPDTEKRLYDFSACHTAGTDLVYTSKFGQIFITRNYASVLSIPDDTERMERWAQQTIIIDLFMPIRQLAVNTTGQVVVSTTKHIAFFDIATLPSLPMPAGSVPPIRVHSILGLDPASVEGSSCLQMTDKKIYAAYRMIPDEVEMVGGQALQYEADVPYQPLRPGSNHGYVMKEWDFTP